MSSEQEPDKGGLQLRTRPDSEQHVFKAGAPKAVGSQLGEGQSLSQHILKETFTGLYWIELLAQVRTDDTPRSCELRRLHRRILDAAASARTVRYLTSRNHEGHL